MREVVIGVDLGATKILTGAITTGGQILAKAKFPTCSGERDAGEILDLISNSIIKTIEDNCFAEDEIRGIAVAAPGPLSYPDVEVVDSPNLGWSKLFLKDELCRRLGRQVIVEKDTNMAVLGEYFFGQRYNCRCLLYITVSTGIGGGIMIDGKLYRGSGGGAGEFGHMVLDPRGPRCKCGRHGCWEALASGTAIAREAAGFVSQGKGEGILANCAEGEQIGAREVGDAARKGDPEASAIILRASRYLGIGIANLVNIFNPDTVVLGGGVALGLQDLFYDSLLEHVCNNVFALNSRNLKIEMTKLGNDIGLWGCLASVLYSP